MISHVFFFKQKTAYEMRISDWSSDVCSSDLSGNAMLTLFLHFGRNALEARYPRQYSVAGRKHERAAAFPYAFGCPRCPPVGAGRPSQAEAVQQGQCS